MITLCCDIVFWAGWEAVVAQRVCTYQKFWNRCLGLESVYGHPDIIDQKLEATQRFCARFRNFGIGAFRPVPSDNDFLHFPEILESVFVFWVVQKFCETFRYFGLGDLRRTKVLCTYQKYWNRCLVTISHIPEILDRYSVTQKFCGGSRNSGPSVFCGHTKIL